MQYKKEICRNFQRGRPSTPSNNAFAQPNAFPNSSQTSSAFGTNNFPYKSEGAFSFQNPTQTPGSSITSNTAGFSNGGNINWWK
ncbi:hypothetical protein CFP56_017770 [Quercus suber]|uniref:Uncharacterized protein n=1 Tax=Quercus suber TaxID=58331 RepID=A0AAW0KLX1_QUESU